MGNFLISLRDCRYRRKARDTKWAGPTTHFDIPDGQSLYCPSR